MAAGWKRFTGSSQYPELTSNKDGSAFTYGTKQNRRFRMTWIQGKRNEQDERDILDWISRVCSENVPKDRETALETLYDGKILCRFLYALNPKALKRPINLKPPLFSANENITNFLDSIIAFGLREVDLFNPSELLEKRSLTGLVSTLMKLQEKIKLFKYKYIYDSWLVRRDSVKWKRKKKRNTDKDHN